MSLATICTAIAGVSVTANGRTPLVYEPSHATRNVRASYDTALLPCRVVLPFGGITTVAGRALTIGGAARSLECTLVDLLLWESAGQTRGLVDVMPDLLAYIDAYSDAIRAHLKLTASPTAIVERWTFAPDLITYGGRQYWGVETTLTVKETT